MIDYKQIRMFSFLVLIGFLISIIFNLGYLFFIFYVLLIGLFILKYVYWKKNNKFKEKKRMLILHRLLKSHCNGCMYFSKKIVRNLNKRNKKELGKNYQKITCCKNKNSFKRINCIGNYSILIKSIKIMSKNDIISRKSIRFLGLEYNRSLLEFLILNGMEVKDETKESN